MTQFAGRISVDENEPEACQRLAPMVDKVKFNGEAIDNVVTADSVMGMVAVLHFDDDGKVIRDPEDPLSVRVMRYFGKVEIHMTDAYDDYLKVMEMRNANLRAN